MLANEGPALCFTEGSGAEVYIPSDNCVSKCGEASGFGPADAVARLIASARSGPLMSNDIPSEVPSVAHR